MKHAKYWTLLIATLAAALLWLAFVWTPEVTSQGGHRGPDINRQPAGGDFVLSGAAGPLALADYRGKVVVIYFGYTFCPDVCPSALSNVAQALSLLAPAELSQVAGIFISVDPERDTVDVLKAYAPFFHGNIVGATGSAEKVAEVARQYGARYMKQKPDSAGLYSVDHSSFTYVVAGDGKLAATLPHGSPPQRIVDIIRRLLAAEKLN